MKGVWIWAALLLAAQGIWGSAPRAEARDIEGNHVVFLSKSTDTLIKSDTSQTVSEKENAGFETPMGFSLGDEGQLIYPVIWDGEGECSGKPRELFRRMGVSPGLGRRF